MRFACCIFLLWSAALGAWGSVTSPREFDFGFIASRQTDVDGTVRFKALGPFIETATTTNAATLKALHPVYSVREVEEAGTSLREVVWPVASLRRVNDSSSWRVLLAYGARKDIRSPVSSYRVWVMPIYFQGRDEYMRGYLAVFPVGGVIRNFLRKDRIAFVLFPVTAGSSINQVHTRDVIWPIFSRTKGKGIYRFRFFPFYAQSKHREHFTKRFVMWPIWTYTKYNYPGSSGSGYVLFPLWGRLKLTDQQSWMFLPPLFRFHRGERQNAIYAPWPIIQISRGEINKFYIWPLGGSKQIAGTHSAFLLWPIFRWQEQDKGDVISRQYRAVPLWLAETHRTRGDVETDECRPYVYRHLWPLFSYRREHDRSLFRTLKLWPTRDRHGPIERNFSPLWTLYSRRTNADAAQSELLWGLYRSRRDGDRYRRSSVFPLYAYERDDREESNKNWSILGGLMGYEREGTQKQFRLLYLLRLGGKEESP